MPDFKSRVVMQFISSEQFRFCIQNHTLINLYFYNRAFSVISNIKNIQLSYLITVLKLVTITKLIALHNQNGEVSEVQCIQNRPSMEHAD